MFLKICIEQQIRGQPQVLEGGAKVDNDQPQVLELELIISS